MHYLAVCAVLRNETPHLKEWIRRHIRLGVERFYLYDHESRTPVAETLADYVEAGVVVVRPMRGDFAQIEAYDDCLRTDGPRCRWIAFIDLDEALVLNQATGGTDDLRLLLIDYEDYGGLAVNWALFGSSGHIHLPEGGQIRAYTMRAPRNHPTQQLVKSIVRPDRVHSACNPHFFRYKDGCTCVNEQGVPVHAARAPFSAKRIQCNHYFFRSQFEYAEKFERWRSYHSEERSEEEHWRIFYNQVEQWTEVDETAKKAADFDSRLAEITEEKEFIRLAGLYGQSMEPLDYVVQGRALCGEGKINEARRLLCAADVRHPDEPIIHWLRTAAQLLSGDVTGAERMALGGLRRYYDPEGYLALFKVRLAQGRSDDARALAAFLRTLFVEGRAAGKKPEPALEEMLESLERRLVDLD